MSRYRKRSGPAPAEAPPDPAATGSIFADVNSGIASTGDGATNVINRYEGTAAYRITPLPDGRTAPPGGRWTGSPSGLLLARNRQVPFTGRAQEVAELVRWCTDPAGPDRAARLLHGPGGQGKTRLVLELAAELPSDWSRWEATPGGTSLASPGVEAPGRPALVVVDYTERWPVGVMKTVVEDVAARFRGRLRLLMVARANAGWWSSLRDSLRARGLIPDEQLLSPLAGGAADDRHAAYLAARRRFADALGVRGHEAAEVPTDLGDERYGLMLTVHMAALAAVHALDRNEQPPTDPSALSAYLLDRERNHWEEAHTGGKGHAALNADEMAQVVYVATLVGRLPYDEACTVLAKARVETLRTPGVLLKAHALVYPSGDEDGFLEPLYPDRLGEDFLALCTPGRPGRQAPDHWTRGALDRLLDVPETATAPDWLRHLCTVLVETGRRWPHVAQDHLSPLLRRRPWLALAAGGAVLAALPTLPGIDLASLLTIAARFPPRDSELDVGIAAVMLALEPALLDSAATARRQADIESEVSMRLFNASLHEEGIRAAQRAADLYRGLVDGAVDGERTALLIRLADALDSLGIHLELTGRPAVALTATQEAADILRDLPGDGATGDPPWLLSRVLANLAGRRGLAPAERLRIAEEAVAVSEQWENNHPGWWAELAGALENLAGALARHDRHQEAVERTRQAVAIRKTQFEQAPKGYGPDYARALANLGHRLSQIGEAAEAERATREAVVLYRELALANPVEHRPSLLDALLHLAVLLYVQGRSQQSVPVYEEALQVVETLAGSGNGYESELADVLDGLGLAYGQQPERFDDAVAALARCADLRRRLAAEDPDTHLPHLAQALVDLANLHGQRPEQAPTLALLDEAAGVLRRLRDADPDRYAAQLARIESVASDLRQQQTGGGTGNRQA